MFFEYYLMAILFHQIISVCWANGKEKNDERLSFFFN
jgi:hypothetical protein